MPGPVTYVDTSDVHPGALDELRERVRELVAFVEANEPRILSYDVHLSPDGTRMTVIHAHPDTDSLEHHLEVAGPVFRRLVGLVTVTGIHVYGSPGPAVLEQLRAKAELFGPGGVTVQPRFAGFTRGVPTAG